MQFYQEFIAVDASPLWVIQVIEFCRTACKSGFGDLRPTPKHDDDYYLNFSCKFPMLNAL